MIWLVLLLIPISFVIALPTVYMMKKLGHQLGYLDGAGSDGHIKTEIHNIPNTGGVAIFVGIAIPMITAIIFLNIPNLINLLGPFADDLKIHLAGISQQTPMACTLLIILLVLHIMGLYDDRKPIGPLLKLVIQITAAFIMVYFFDSRLLTLLDNIPGLETLAPWPSILLTIIWFIVITNAINFMDNMDGLAAGVAAIASTLFLVAAIINGQWFIAATLALLLGSLIAFLIFNFPPATIFMGDGGSLVIGFLLAFLTVRTTFYSQDPTQGWYSVFMPLIILAVPLYDFCSVVIIRLLQGKNPLLGDQQHFSHRIQQKGLSKRATILVIYGCTLAIGLGAVGLGKLEGWQAVLVGIQSLVILIVLAVYERAAQTAMNNSRDEL